MHRLAELFSQPIWLMEVVVGLGGRRRNRKFPDSIASN
jgi:hypothetical protein